MSDTWRHALDRVDDPTFFAERHCLDIFPADQHQQLMAPRMLRIGADGALMALQEVAAITDALIDALIDPTAQGRGIAGATVDVTALLVSTAEEVEQWFELAYKKGDWHDDSEDEIA